MTEAEQLIPAELLTKRAQIASELEEVNDWMSKNAMTEDPKLIITLMANTNRQTRLEAELKRADTEIEEEENKAVRLLDIYRRAAEAAAGLTQLRGALSTLEALDLSKLRQYGNIKQATLDLKAEVTRRERVISSYGNIVGFSDEMLKKLPEIKES